MSFRYITIALLYSPVWVIPTGICVFAHLGHSSRLVCIHPSGSFLHGYVYSPIWVIPPARDMCIHPTVSPGRSVFTHLGQISMEMCIHPSGSILHGDVHSPIWVNSPGRCVFSTLVACYLSFTCIFYSFKKTFPILCKIHSLETDSFPPYHPIRPNAFRNAIKSPVSPSPPWPTCPCPIFACSSPPASPIRPLPPAP